MKLLSTKQLLISTVSQIDIEIFSHLKQLQTKLIDIDKVVINYDPEKIAVEKILRCISDANLQIKDISTKQPDLEEVFKHLIAKK